MSASIRVTKNVGGLNLEKFHSAVQIYKHRPQVVNRRCGGSVILREQNGVLLAEPFDVLYKFCSGLSEKGVCTKSEDEMTDSVPELSEELIVLLTFLQQSGMSQSRFSVSVRKLVSKQSTTHFPHEIIIAGELVYHFIPVETDKEKGLLYPVGVSYSLMYDEHKQKISMETRSHTQLSCTTTSSQWLHQQLLPKITKWAESDLPTSCEEHNKSMKLVDIDTYYDKYTTLKDKYGKAICEIWPECTDPLKFVYEDVAIACYLMCIWERERVERGSVTKQTFVDLGCGNGLLVYILSSEGYDGYGVDVRRRKIWSLFEKADLREVSLVPSEAELFPNTDWLIGNHSDELTPWIPVMAARSSRNCQLFLLPCCPHDFYQKFQRPNSSKAIYGQYLDFVCAVVSKCGFSYKRDSLRIPSTRKECIIGLRQPHLTEDRYQEIDIDITRLVKVPSSSTDIGTVSFTPRAPTESVRNCATVSRTVQSQIISLLTSWLLQTKIYKSKPIPLDDGEVCHHLQQPQWNTGGVMALSDVAALLQQRDLLTPLKSECGGLQTLLKNHHHIFKVVPRLANVRLTDFTLDQREMSPEQLALNAKTRLCWFFEFHPDGCLLSATKCRYAHGQSEQRVMRHRPVRGESDTTSANQTID